METDEIVMLYEDRDIMVCVKPQGMPSQSDATGDADLLSLLQAKTKNPQLGLVHRLDRGVGGVMALAKTKAANAALSQAIQAGRFEKNYIAVVNGQVPAQAQAGRAVYLTDWLFKNQRLNVTKVVARNTPGAKESKLCYTLLSGTETEADGYLSQLSIALMTGRHHQIRVQLAQAGLPVWGDTKYNPAFRHKSGFHQMALWAHELRFVHPGTGRAVSFTSHPPERHPFEAGWTL